MLTVIIVAIVIGTSLWAALDASKLQTGLYKGHNSPAATFLACLLLWIIIFPIYLIRRNSLVNGTAILKATGQLGSMNPGWSRNIGALPASPGPQLIAKIILGCLPIFVVIMIAVGSLNPSLPGCGDQQVQNLVIQILKDQISKSGYNINNVSLSLGSIANTGVNNETKGLTCTAQITIASEGEERKGEILYRIDKNAANKKEFIVTVQNR